MAERIIDLAQKYRREEASDETPRAVSGSETQTPRKKEAIEWSAPEYERRERSIGWYLGTGATALGFIIVAVFAQNYLFIVFIVLAYFVLVMYTRKEPRRIVCALTNEGIGIDDAWHPWSDFVSFCIFDRSAIRELSLETRKTIAPYVRLPLGAADAEKIKLFLARLLPEKEHPELLTDHLARRLGF